LTKCLKDLKEDVEVAKVLELDELLEGVQLGVVIVMSRDISLEISLFRDDLCVPTAGITPMPPRISPS
jgi:hypothetical protein